MPPDRAVSTGAVAPGAVPTGAQETEVQVLIASSGEDQPRLSVRMGAVTVHVGDWEALSSFVDAWRQAVELADTAFGFPSGAVGPRTATEPQHRSA